MTIPEFIERMDDTQAPAPEAALTAFEASIGCSLPEDYREFLIASNGGFIGGDLWFLGPNPDGEETDAGVHHVGGFREESYFSLIWARECYQDSEFRIPRELLWVMDDPFGNAICIGLTGSYRGKMYFWDHEGESDPEDWDGSAGTADNITLLANSFTEFVAGLEEQDE